MKARAFILGGYVNGLGLVRSLARIGVRSVVFDHEMPIAGFSRWATHVRCPHPTADKRAFIASLRSAASREPAPPVVFATNDIWLLPILEQEDVLRSTLLMPMSGWEVVRQCYDKWLLFTLAQAHGIPTPRTYRVTSTEELRQVANRMPFPAILKPVDTIGFMEALGRRSRTIPLYSHDDAHAAASELDRAGFHGRETILQEHVPGGVDNLFTYTSYSNREASVLAWSVGHKIRQWPPNAGTITAGRVVRNEAVERLGESLINAVGFHGIANTEFKRDIRTGEFKLIEINPRPGMWNRSALATGVNLPAMAFLEATGSKLERAGTTDQSVVWLHAFADAKHLLHGDGTGGGAWSVIEWWRSLAGPKVLAIFDASDPMPSLVHAAFTIGSALRRRKGVTR